MRVIAPIVAVVAVLIVLALLVNAMKRNTLFFPSRFPTGQWSTATLVTKPSDITIPVSGNVELHGWLFKAAAAKSPLIIWSHGNGGNITDRAPTAAELARRGISVLLYDYRGYGKSGGRPEEQILYDDVLAVYDAAVSRGYGDQSAIVSYGESLGGPYSAYMASRRPVSCVVIENSFHSAASVANAVYRIPIGVFLGRSLSTARFLNRAKVPVLIMHGRNDQTIPLRAALDLHEALDVPKELWLIDDARHSELSSIEGYYEKVIDFIRRSQKTK